MPLGEIFKTANDRLKSPFLSSFIFSWTAFNWKAIFVAFAGDENVYTKIDCIESDYLNVGNTLWFPLIIALAYTILFPYLKVLFDRLTTKAQIDWVTQNNKRELKRLQGSISIANAEFRLEQAKAGTDELKELNDQIDKLKEDLNNKDSKNAILNEKINDFKKNQTQLEKSIKESEKKLDTTKTKFSGWFEIDKTGNSPLKDFYGIIDDNQYSSFKVIVSAIDSKKNTVIDLEEMPEEIQYFINQGLISTIRIKSDKEPLIKFQLTERGIKLKEFMEYYEPPF